MKYLQIIFCLLAVVSVHPPVYAQSVRTGCVFPKAGDEQVESVSLPDGLAFEDASKHFPARGEAADWGIAMSGGGIRSGSFNIGVLKALYDAGLLDQVDVISSVSGGGFASYWLYGLHDLSFQGRFGEPAFGDGVYLRNVCDLQSSSGMYSLSKMLRTFLMTRNQAFADYRASIHRTFGRNASEPCSRTVASYGPAINRGSMPYFILNTSIDTGELFGIANVVEITPNHIGNSILGFSTWKTTESALNHATGVAASAAGIRWKLKRTTQNFAPFILNNRKKAGHKLNLFDGGGRVTGGGGENLAALALIRRGVRNVVIIDAGHDPEYEFEDFEYLRGLLEGLGMSICISENEQCDPKNALPKEFRTGVFTGEVTVGEGERKRLVSNVYYVKMSRPLSIFSEAEVKEIAKLKTAEKRESYLRVKYDDGAKAWESREKKIRIGTSGSRSTVKCTNALDMSFDPGIYDYVTRSYGYFLDASKWKNAEKIHRFLTYRFPHTTTADQSFKSDQLEAFVGLGYLQGRALTAVLNKE